MAEWVWHDERAKAALHKLAVRAVMRGAIKLQDAVRANLRMRATGRDRASEAPPGGPPGQRTGQLTQSILSLPLGQNDRNPWARVGTNLVYAKVHEFGLPIVSSGKLLTIPLNDEARRLRRIYGDLTQVPGLFFVKDKESGNLFLATVTGTPKTKGGGEVRYLFLLRRAVKMPARPFFRPARDRVRGEVLEAMKAAFGVGVRTVG